MKVEKYDFRYNLLKTCPKFMVIWEYTPMGYPTERCEVFGPSGVNYIGVASFLHYRAGRLNPHLRPYKLNRAQNFRIRTLVHTKDCIERQISLRQTFL